MICHSLAILKKIGNVCKYKCDFLYHFWFYIKLLKEERGTPSHIFFQGFCLDLALFFTTPLDGFFQNSLLDISNFLLRFVKTICRKFLFLYDRGNIFQRHYPSWYPTISSSVFSILFDFAIFTPFSISMFSEIYYSLKAPVLLHFEKRITYD